MYCLQGFYIAKADLSTQNPQEIVGFSGQNARNLQKFCVLSAFNFSQNLRGIPVWFQGDLKISCFGSEFWWDEVMVKCGVEWWKFEGLKKWSHRPRQADRLRFSVVKRPSGKAINLPIYRVLRFLQKRKIEQLFTWGYLPPPCSTSNSTVVTRSLIYSHCD